MPSIVLADPKSAPAYSDSPLQRALLRAVRDPRDVVFLRVALKSLALVPLIVLLYWRFSWWLAAAFSLLQLAWLAPPAILMLHNTMHRPFLKWPRAERVIPYAMSALFGIPTGYMEHHVAMHHVENNLPSDLSSTMRYQRDHFGHWLVYWLRFMFLIHVELSRYLYSKGRKALARRALVSDFVHLSAMAMLLALNWRATLVAFVAPYVAVRFMMMIGNWGQHAFVDASRPGDSYVNSITCINSGYNARCFNDGYHIGHHVKQNRHWAELPQDFLDNQERYAKEGCIVFEGLDFFMVSVLLFARRYDVLAKRFVRLPGDSRSDVQVEAVLRERTRRIPDSSLPVAVPNAA